MATMVNSKLCQTSEMELFPQVVTSFRGELKSCQASKTKSHSLFLQKSPSWVVDKVLNMFLNWLPKLRMFHF